MRKRAKEKRKEKIIYSDEFVVDGWVDVLIRRANAGSLRVC